MIITIPYYTHKHTHIHTLTHTYTHTYTHTHAHTQNMHRAIMKACQEFSPKIFDTKEN